MGILFDLLIPTLIILGVAFVWLRALLGRFFTSSRPDARRASVHPRSLASSGGYLQAPSPPEELAPQPMPAQRRREVVEPQVETRQSRPERQSRPSTGRAYRTVRTSQAQALVRALESPGAVRTGFLIKEILEPPISLREPVNPGDGRP